MMNSKSETQQQLPKINFSGLVVGTPEWIAVRTEVMNALHVYGTFEAVYDPHLDAELREQVFRKAITELFDLPTHVKSLSVSYTSKSYIPSEQGFTVYEGNVESIQSLTSLMWPQGNSHFCETMQRYGEAMKELNEMITRMILESLGVDKYYDEMTQKTNYMLRAICYKNEEEDKDDLYMGTHTDIHFLTIVAQHEVDGLEVLIKSGQWIKPAPYSYIVFLGDSLQAWTNGRVQAIDHRICKNQSHDTRYVTQFMSRGAKEFIIQAPPELIDATHPVLYKPFDFNDYFQFYLSKLGSMPAKPLKTFCGIEKPAV
ncbi:Iron/ascorbate family oxidoreductases protein [Dioscorea alata]|uniref:Iron/ascorbate family oxidoreductases protein n=1 Tax=Dioscorea alata TaxID=55571 RepID=A0ACB7WFX1_DIOAL|nr:Iron/ascorbate family oxidoreductases protein [Dioscorea alata]